MTQENQTTKHKCPICGNNDATILREELRGSIFITFLKCNVCSHTKIYPYAFIWTVDENGSQYFD